MATTTTHDPLVICLGATVLDTVLEVDELPRAPIKFLARRRVRRGGGPGATGCVACARLNVRAELWSWLGKDAEGAFLYANLQRHGVDVTSTPLYEGAETILAFVFVDRKGERMIVAHGNFPSQLSVANLPLDRVAKADAVLVDSAWRAGAAAVLETARAARVPAVLDAETHDADVLMDLARRSSVPVLSEDGFEKMAGGAIPDAASCAGLADRLHTAVIGVTLGHRGSLWWLNGGLAHVPALPVVARDTTGAGDVFHGALVAALAEHRELLDAARFASAAAGLKCALGNGWDGMPDRESVEQAMRRLA